MYTLYNGGIKKRKDKQKMKKSRNNVYKKFLEDVGNYLNSDKFKYNANDFGKDLENIKCVEYFYATDDKYLGVRVYVCFDPDFLIEIDTCNNTLSVITNDNNYTIDICANTSKCIDDVFSKMDNYHFIDNIQKISAY